ncbi:apbE family protein, partial [Neisseria meningitidis]|nr:apbE family protein [Neisseria meningitidis]
HSPKQQITRIGQIKTAVRKRLRFSDGIFFTYSGLTKTSTALPRLSSKRTIL